VQKVQIDDEEDRKVSKILQKEEQGGKQ